MYVRLTRGVESVRTGRIVFAVHICSCDVDCSLWIFIKGIGWVSTDRCQAHHIERIAHHAHMVQALYVFFFNLALPRCHHCNLRANKRAIYSKIFMPWLFRTVYKVCHGSTSHLAAHTKWHLLQLTGRTSLNLAYAGQHAVVLAARLCCMDYATWWPAQSLAL